jgi:UDP-glucose 4-epimerase
MTSAQTTLLITGGCGYLGSQFLRDLATDARFGNVTVRILDNLQRGQTQALMDLPGAATFQFVEGDILDAATVRLALRDVDAVIHLAAVVRTPLSFENPAWLEQVNHWGTAQLIEACLQSGVQRLIFASSTAVYGPGGPYREGDACRPQGAYAQSKYAAEQSILTARARGLQPTILRFGTLFGVAPVMRFEAVANRFAYLAGIERPLTVYGDGRQRRPFIHTRDASAAIRHCLLQIPPGELFNVVGVTASILDLVEALRQQKPALDVRFVEQDIRTHFSFDATSATLEQTGWSPTVDLESGLGELMGRFQHLSKYPARPDV